MPLHDSLLSVAQDLASLDRGRPRQASLRRAVSTGYYAVFHMLVDAATRRLCGTDRALRSATARGFTHTGIKQVVDQLLLPPSRRPAHLVGVVGASALSAEALLVCQALSDAQAERESADYELDKGYRRSTVKLLLDQVDRAFAAWRIVRGSSEGQRLVLALILYSRGRTR